MLWHFASLDNKFFFLQPLTSDIYSDLDVSGKSSSQGKSKTKKIQKHTTNEIPFPGSTSTNDQVGVSADRTFTKVQIIAWKTLKMVMSGLLFYDMSILYAQ